MKKYILFPLMLLVPAFATAQVDDEGGSVQTEVYESDVAFQAVKPEGKNLTEAQKTALLSKIERIIAKNNAGTISEHDAFGIKADIDIQDSKSSAGLVRNVTVLTAEVTLTAFNVADGSIYYSNSVRLETDVVGDAKLAMDKLINSIKVTDPQFVRFIRTARKRIAQWYNDRGLPLPIRQEKKEPEVKHDTVVVVQEVLVEQQQPVVSQQVPVEQPVQNNTPVVENPVPQKVPACDITLSTGDIDFQILSTQVDLTRKRFSFTAKITNNKGSGTLERMFKQAFDQDGNQLDNLKVTENSHYIYEDYPKDLGVRRTFMVDGITAQTTMLSYILLSVGRTEVVIKNLPVKNS